MKKDYTGVPSIYVYSYLDNYSPTEIGIRCQVRNDPSEMKQYHIDGVDVFRSESANGNYVKVGRMNAKEFINDDESDACVFKDKTVVSGKYYYYKLRPCKAYGQTTIYGDDSSSTIKAGAINMLPKNQITSNRNINSTSDEMVITIVSDKYNESAGAHFNSIIYYTEEVISSQGISKHYKVALNPISYSLDNGATWETNNLPILLPDQKIMIKCKAENAFTVHNNGNFDIFSYY